MTDLESDARACAAFIKHPAADWEWRPDLEALWTAHGHDTYAPHTDATQAMELIERAKAIVKPHPVQS